jgi:hypothetical protein
VLAVRTSEPVLGPTRDGNAIRRTARRVGLVAVLGAVTVLLIGDAVVWMVSGPAPLRFLGVELPLGRFEAEIAIAALLAAVALVAAGGLHTRCGPPVAVATITVAVLLANTMPMGSGDTVPATFLPFVLLRDGRLTFDDPGLDGPLGVHGEPLPYYLVRTGGGLASKYSPAMGILAAPVYLPAALGRFDPHLASVLHLGKLAAAILTALGAGCLFVAARALVGGVWAVAATGLYVLATPVLSVLGQALWQHTGAALGFSVALMALTLTNWSDRRAGALAGVGLGVVVACRPVDVVLAAGLGFALLRERPRAVPWALGVGAIPLLLLGWYHWRVFGSPFTTGYGVEARDGWTTPLHEGVLGLLFSPARGLFLQSPVLLVSAGALLSGARPPRWLLPPVVALGMFTLLMGRWWCWNGGYSAGNRMLADGLPVLGLTLAVGLRAAWARAPMRPVVLGLATISVATFAVLTFVRPTPEFRELVLEMARGPWDVESHPVVALLRRR